MDRKGRNYERDMFPAVGEACGAIFGSTPGIFSLHFFGFCFVVFYIIYVGKKREVVNLTVFIIIIILHSFVMLCVFGIIIIRFFYVHT